MSYLDEHVDWESFSLREIPFEVDLFSPAAEMAACMQRIVQDVSAIRQEVSSTREKGLSALAQQATLVFQFEAVLELYKNELTDATLKKVHRHFRVLKDQMRDALKQASIEVEDPIGASYDEVAETVEVIGWRFHEDFDKEVVAEVQEPIVKSNGVLIRAGRVVMGAPPQAEILPS